MVRKGKAIKTTREFIGKHEGKFCVCFADRLHSEPVEEICYWLIEEQGLLKDTDVGLEVDYLGLGGEYLVETSRILRVIFHLVGGDAPKPVHTEEKFLAPPITDLRVTYREGHWRKLVVGKGWEIAD